MNPEMTEQKWRETQQVAEKTPFVTCLKKENATRDLWVIEDPNHELSQGSSPGVIGVMTEPNKPKKEKIFMHKNTMVTSASAVLKTPTQKITKAKI